MPAAWAFLSGFADLPRCLVDLAAAREHHRFAIRRQPHARDRLPIIACVMGYCRGKKSGESATQMLRSPFLSKTQATRGACDALVRPEGNGALSACSIVKLSPGQTTGSNMPPRIRTRNWNNVFNAIAHYHDRTIARRLDSAENWLNNFEKGFRLHGWDILWH